MNITVPGKGFDRIFPVLVAGLLMFTIGCTSDSNSSSSGPIREPDTDPGSGDPRDTLRRLAPAWREPLQSNETEYSYNDVTYDSAGDLVVLIDRAPDFADQCIALAKFSSDGTRQWYKPFDFTPTPPDPIPKICPQRGDVATDGNGNIYTLAEYRWEAAPPSPADERYAMFLRKHTPDGDTARTHWYDEGTGDTWTVTAYGYNFTVAPDGTAIVTGNIRNPWLAKYKPDGSLDWRNVDADTSVDDRHTDAVRVDDAGDIYLIRHIDASSIAHYITIEKLDSEGIHQWERGSIQGYLESFNVGPGNSAYVLSHFPEYTPESTSLRRFSSEGEFPWYVEPPLPHDRYLAEDRRPLHLNRNMSRMAVSSDGSIYLVGSARIEREGYSDSAPDENVDPAILIQKYSEDGVLLWLHYSDFDIGHVNYTGVRLRINTAAMPDGGGEIAITGQLSFSGTTPVKESFIAVIPVP